MARKRPERADLALREMIARRSLHRIYTEYILGVALHHENCRSTYFCRNLMSSLADCKVGELKSSGLEVWWIAGDL
jgi:hypothetical protein